MLRHDAGATANSGGPKVIQRLIACVIDDDIIGEVKSGKPTGQSAADLFVVRALRRLSRAVELVAAVERDACTIEELVRLRPSVVFNLAFSARPCEPCFAGALEMLGIPYTGSGPLGIALASDKVRSRHLLRAAGIRVPRFVQLSRTRRPATIDFAPPFIVKPVLSGNSVGIHASSVVDSYARAMKCADRIWRELEEPAVCDEFIVGREFHVGMVETARGVFRTTAIVELQFAGAELGRGFMTEAVRVKGKVRRACKVLFRQAALTDRKMAEMAEIAGTAANLLHLRGYAKVDLRMDDQERITVIEANPNPGLWDGEIWRQPNFETNLACIMDAARRRARE